MEGYLPINKKPQCSWINCAAGGGVAGSGHCFFGGDPEEKNCNKFYHEDEFIRNLETATGLEPACG